jgi:hypothetical protein
MRNTWKILCAATVVAVVTSAGFTLPPIDPQYVETIELPGGVLLDRIVVPGGLPPAVKMKAARVPIPNIAAGTNVLTNVPAFDWSYGCSATCGAMLAGYYDRTGYPDMYTGPANGGLCPLDNSTWGYGECPLSATHLGIDGRAVRGHVDDYYVSYGSSAPDPFITNGWPEHSSADCTGDFMRTNQSNYGNVDGSTIFYNYTDGSPFASTDYPEDGGYGLELFLESRGYTVTSRFNQYIVEQGLTYGFSFAQYQQEIDAGRPVLIQVAGHTMLGIGYNTTGSIIYIHDTWDHSVHTMTWAGTYGGMNHYGVTVVRLADNGSVFSDGFESGDSTSWSQTVP